MDLATYIDMKSKVEKASIGPKDNSIQSYGEVKVLQSDPKDVESYKNACIVFKITADSSDGTK